MNFAQNTNVDRVQVIRRSIRCFIFGIIGTLPFLGLGLSVLSFRLARQVARQTGDRVSLKLINICWICGLILSHLYLFAIGPNAAIGVIVIFLGLQIYLLRSQFCSLTPPQWNPARHFLFWGVGLAYSGVVLSVALGIDALIMVAKNF